MGKELSFPSCVHLQAQDLNRLLSNFIVCLPLEIRYGLCKPTIIDATLQFLPTTPVAMSKWQLQKCTLSLKKSKRG